MGQRFVACDREQPFLMLPDVREWLPPRQLAWFVIDAVGEIDLKASRSLTEQVGMFRTSRTYRRGRAG